ncbi:Dual specificity protein phosphatase 22 [Tyrophagus putrescentiae]|nr:Dual specificity protein phosphatase 22 [Tyrophagus putrescentiae]
MNQILPRLFIGGLRDARDTEQMKANDIRYVLSVHETARNGNLQGVQYLCIQAADSPTQNLSQFFSASNDFIHRCRCQREEGGGDGSGSVLIHCLAGVSRSVTLLVAYLISITSLSVKQALEAVRHVRAIAEPNPGFHRQLTDFEGVRLRAEQRRLAGPISRADVAQ